MRRMRMGERRVKEYFDPMMERFIKLEEDYLALGKQSLFGLLTSLAMAGVGVYFRDLFMIVGGTGFSIMFGYGFWHAKNQWADVKKAKLEIQEIREKKAGGSDGE